MSPRTRSTFTISNLAESELAAACARTGLPASRIVSAALVDYGVNERVTFFKDGASMGELTSRALQLSQAITPPDGLIPGGHMDDDDPDLDEHVRRQDEWAEASNQRIERRAAKRLTAEEVDLIVNATMPQGVTRAIYRLYDDEDGGRALEVIPVDDEDSAE